MSSGRGHRRTQEGLRCFQWLNSLSFVPEDLGRRGCTRYVRCDSCGDEWKADQRLSIQPRAVHLRRGLFKRIGRLGATLKSSGEAECWAGFSGWDNIQTR